MIKTKGVDLLLVHPGTNKKVYEKLADEFAAIEPPFVAALTAGFVRDKGYSVDILDANAENLTSAETAEIVKDYDPRLINIIVHGHQPSASSHLMGAVGETCKEIKGRINTPILLRGIHPSSLPERTLREEAVDYVARGEGYHTLLGLLEKKQLSNISGLCWIDGENNFNMNKSPTLIENLDETLPNVAWDLLPMQKYRSHNWHSYFTDIEERKPYGSIYTSLGCPFRCSFCCINAEFKASIADNLEKKVDNKNGKSEIEMLRVIDNAKPTIRYWSPKTVLRHIETLVEKYGVKHMKFIDEMYVFDRRHVEGIAKGIIERGYDLNIWAYARIDTIRDDSLLTLMKKSGINWLILGIESANKEVRNGADKKFDNDSIFKNVKRVENAGINVMGNFMVGLRTDSPETMRETLEMAKELNTPWFNIYPTMAYPGAPDYLWAKQRGIALPGDENIPGGWTAYSHHSYYTLPLPTEKISSAEVLKFRDQAFTDYFTNTSYLSMIEKKFGVKAIDHLKRMTSYKIKRRILGE